jgi:hypothetical protein
MCVEIVGSVYQVEDHNCLHELDVVDVTITVQIFIVTIIRDIRTCIHIQLTQDIILLQNIFMQNYECN